MAPAIHDASRRQTTPFVAFNCSGVPDGLIESELFGYGRGAFTGANNGGKKGLIEEANGGTLFLYEIGDMPLAAQARLLRVLQDQMVRRLGENQSVRVDVRIIAATNKDLTEAIEKSEFRQDLFYRPNVIEIPLPPLRERPEDITALAEKFRIDCADRERKSIEGFTDAAHEVLRRHSWPGNIRELENVIHHAAVMADDGGLIRPEHFPKLQGASSSAPRTGETNLRSLQEVMAEHVHKVLEHTHGNRTEAAEILGITTTTLRGYAGTAASYRAFAAEPGRTNLSLWVRELLSFPDTDPAHNIAIANILPMEQAYPTAFGRRAQRWRCSPLLPRSPLRSPPSESTAS